MPRSLTFGLLGPLRIQRGGERLAPSGPRQQAVLAALLLRANEVVSTDSLIDAVWGEDPPPTARTSLQVHVSKLRRLLDGDPGVEIETEPPGYRMRVDHEAVDALRFRTLLDEGVDALASGDAERAADVLGRALSLWRGRPLEGVDAPGIAPFELIDLEEAHVRARVLLAEASLGVGRDAEVLADLERLHAEHPVDERIATLTAVALYRCGRQSDALEVLAKLRRELSTELGIDPGPAVADLERQILSQDPSLSASRAVPQPSVRIGRKSVTAVVARLAGTPTGDPEAFLGPRGAEIARVRDLVEAGGGTVEEFGAGRLVAVFGIPLANDDDALRAMRVAWGLSRSDAARAGVATGEVLVEDREGAQRLLSTGPIESADELASAAERGEALLDERTERLTRSAAASEPANDRAYRAVDPYPIRAPAETPFVGRESELDTLELAFRKVVRGRTGSLVTVLGSAGVGKSALIGRFLASLGGATVASGRCLAYGREISFWPVAEIVHQLAGLVGTEPSSTTMSRLEEIVGDDPDADFIAHEVAAVIGPGSISPTPDELHWAIRRFFEHVASDDPLVLVFEDMHWADDTLLDLVTYLSTWIKEAPVLVVCAARSEFLEARPSWGSGRIDAVNLLLDPLGEAHAAEMIAAILGGDLSADVARRIQEATEGHPLFIRELLSMLRDDGALVEKDDTWVAVGGVTSVPIPPTVRAVLDARLDRSSPRQRRVLEIASVVGRDFTIGNLSAFGDVDELAGVLDELIERDLITGGGSRTSKAYRFRHILLRDAAYAGISKELRARYHRAFAAALEASEDEHIAGFDEIAGYHLESAYAYEVELGAEGDRSLAERAATHFGAAARRALRLEDMPAAANLASRARALTDRRDPKYPDLAWTEAEALSDLGRASEVAGVIQDGLSSAVDLGDEAMTWRLRVQELGVRIWLAPEPGSEHSGVARDAIAELTRLGDDIGLARAYRTLGDALHLENRFDEAVVAFQHARRLALDCGDEREANQRPAFGVTLGPMPVPACIDVVESSMDSAPRPNPDGLAQLAFLYAMDERAEPAREMAERAVVRARELGEWRAAAVEMYAAEAYLALDDPRAAEEVVRPAVETLDSIGERNLLPTAAALLGEARFRSGDLGEAMTFAALAERSAAPDDDIAQMQWRELRAKVLAAQGQHDEAERFASEAVLIAREGAQDTPHLAGTAFLDQAYVLEAAGRVGEAIDSVDEAIARFRAKGDRTGASRAEEMRERLQPQADRSTAREP